MGNDLDPDTEATYEKLKQALTDHISQSNGEARFVGDFFIVAASYGESIDQVRYSCISSESAPHPLEGLLRLGLRRIIDEDREP